MCAPANKSHRAGSRPGRSRPDAAFFRHKISAIKSPLCTRNTRNATELPFLEISPRPTTTTGPGHGLATTNRLWLWVGRVRPDVGPRLRRALKPRLGRGLSTTASFCGLEISRGALWALHDGQFLWLGISQGGVVGSPRRTIVAWNFRGGRTWDRDSAVQGRDPESSGGEAHWWEPEKNLRRPRAPRPALGD